MTAEPGTAAVAVIGDGPAGSALAAELTALGVEAVLVGRGRPWSNTYGLWLDDVEHLPEQALARRCGQVVVGGRRLRRIDRAYGIVDNLALREHLDAGVRRVVGEVGSVDASHDGAAITLVDGSEVRAELAVLATGAPEVEPSAWQTAYGVVVDERTAGEVAATDAATIMDWSWSGSVRERPTVPSFLYVVPTRDGWLVEHTVLAASPAVAPEALRAALVERLGSAVVTEAEAAGRVETVRIPMGVPLDAGAGAIARFGVAAGMSHPATGYSVGAALRAAPRVAQAIAAGADVSAAVWPVPARRARALHEYGLDVLLRLGPDANEAFFDAFFELPVERWREYLRVDTTPRAVASVMGGVFRRVPWSVRGRLWRGDLRKLAAGVRRRP